MRTDAYYLWDIIDAADAIDRFLTGYFKIDWDIIWGAATKDAPLLREAATQMLQEQFPNFRVENG